MRLVGWFIHGVRIQYVIMTPYNYIYTCNRTGTFLTGIYLRYIPIYVSGEGQLENQNSVTQRGRAPVAQASRSVLNERT